MKTLIVDAYRFVYRISGAKMFSVVIAIIYVSILNMVVLCGLSLLLEGLMPTSFIHRLFVFPYYFVTGALMLVVMFRYKPSKKAIAKEAKTTKDYTFIIVYTLASIILYLYMQYGVKLNFSERKKIGRIELSRSAGKKSTIQ
jgi:hypothetical protein